MSYSTVDIPDWEWDTSNPFAPAFPDISLSIPEVVEESSCLRSLLACHRGLDSMALWTLSSRFGLFVSPRTGLYWIAGATLLSRQ